ncbi:MAG: STAS domain-containing protein [Candidatus Hydrogenedentes bacterium]|jgi:anti-sigma B factor antagonist|nr:STAS domain-containing protein [Candidatus Hydrogenedentota bacterium]MCC6698467.1 STAS domain-containing protein [Candidatus Hydrogenedentota bacterium]
MNVERTDMGAVTVLRLQGDIDENGVDALRTALYECISENRFKVVMNLSAIRFISYMGVGVLVERLRKVRALNGDIKLVGINLYTQRLFRMVGVSSLFDTYDSEQKAAGTFQEAA